MSEETCGHRHEDDKVPALVCVLKPGRHVQHETAEGMLFMTLPFGKVWVWCNGCDFCLAEDHQAMGSEARR